MPFKVRPNDYQIEEAASGRAECRRCHKKIGKGALRLRIVAFVCPGRSTAFFRCAECVDPKLAAAVLTVCGAAERVPCTSKMEATRADQLRKALSLAAQDPAVGAQPVAGESEGRFCSQ